MPPSDEGGGKIFDFDGGRDSPAYKLTTPQSPTVTAPLTRGAQKIDNQSSQQIQNYILMR